MSELETAIRELASPWLDERTGAIYFRVSEARFVKVSKSPGFPALHKNGKWHRDELDAWMEGIDGGLVSRHPLYNTWKKMLDRCGNPKAPQWRWYGARGITVCDRWRSFVKFAEDMGARPAGCTLDRIDNERGYAPNNCRWATQAQQYANRRQAVPLGAVIAMEMLG